MSDDTGTVFSELHVGGVLLLTLSFPARRNAISMRMRAVLEERLEQAQTDPACRAIVLTGEGEHFCSGGDLTSFAGVTSSGGRLRMQNLHRIIRMMAAGRKPIVAAVEGAAMGAGLGLAAACDVIVASQTAKFSVPFARFNLVPDYGGMWTLTNRIGMGRTRLLVMSGRTIRAEEAERIGLVEQIVPAGTALAEALALAGQIAKGAPLSHEYLKAVLARGPAGLEDVLAAEADAQGVLYGTEDYVEGYTSFFEKREPQFKGQ
ncbi:enoyl-CoA hydratase-related protein [Sphingobium sp. Sx8-8]|uniref:enoyl-CoA hydratase/isomerase family protein n=1 Tax=Sphingobium sp. Sx8-8 TaxID=2933617 RepID=UPI001F582D13|nr:enoyl-CoA hydratase-related protein [Sphingobium sp. Sx8-8]